MARKTEPVAAAELSAADTLNALCEKHGATYERVPKGDEVLVQLTNADGERLAGRGATTAEAVTNLAARAAEVWNA